jgi:cytochrome c oxidase subunit 2
MTTLQRASAFLGALLYSALAHADPIPETGSGMPHDASEYGHNIDWLIHVTGIFVIILFIIMVAWMLWAVLVHNEKHEAEYDLGESKQSVKTALTLSAVIFLIVDGNLWWNSTMDVNKIFWNFAHAQSQAGAVRVEVNAHQWAWDVRYPGPDGKFNTADDFVQLNDLRVPTGVPVVVQLASTDVIHSFFLPNFRLKQDAMPGQVNRLWFQAKETGEFDIGCAQHCGVHHYKMKGRLTVYSPEDYAAWLAQATAIGARAYNPDDPEAHWGWAWKE